MIIRKNISFPLKAGGAVTLKLFAAPASLLRNPAIAGVEPRRGENLRVVVSESKLSMPSQNAILNLFERLYLVLLMNECRIYFGFPTCHPEERGILWPNTKKLSQSFCESKKRVQREAQGAPDLGREH